MTIFKISLAVALFFVVFFYFYILVARRRYKKKQKHILLSVQVSKENELGPLVAEQIYSSIHNADEKISFWQKLKGASVDTISLEIAHIDRNIKFYFWVPENLKNLVEGQIYAQYTDVEITEVEDYAEQNLDSICCAELAFNSPDIYPIKRYPQFEDKLTRVAVDPISGITASLSKLENQEDQAWIQIVIKPLPDKWRKVFVNCIHIIHKGLFNNFPSLQSLYANLFCRRGKLFRIIFFPLYFIFFFQSLSASKKIKSDQKEEDDDLKDEMSKSHERETNFSAALDKVLRLLFETKIRIVYYSKNGNKKFAVNKIKEIAGSFRQFNIPQLNGFTTKEISEGKNSLINYRKRKLDKGMVMNIEELATIFHMPNMIVLTPNIYWVRSKKLEPPSNLPHENDVEKGEFTMLGQTNFRGVHDKFGIKTTDRRRHVYIIGKTGMGKSTLLENMIFSDINNGKGVAVIDPHGDLAEHILDFIPSWRTNHVIIFDPSDRDFPLAFNMLENINPALNTIVCSGLVGIFKKIYGESWGPRLEHILRNTILALLEYPNTTMLGITRMLQDQDFRRKVIAKVTDPIVKSFWINEFAKIPDRQISEAISPILNKVGQFLSSPIIRNIVGQPKSTLDFRFAMDRSKIVIVNLSKGKIGEDISSLLGSMIITKFQLDAMSRADIPEAERKDFYLYVDEFQNFATDSFATILSEARKYRLNLTMANQYIAQMPEEVRDAVFGNVGTIMSFQLGFTDAESLALQFSEEVTENDLVSLSKYSAYTKLLIDGMPSNTFSFGTLPGPKISEDKERINKLFKVSREKYATPREVVEEKINRWHDTATKNMEEQDLKKIDWKEKKKAQNIQKEEDKRKKPISPLIK